MIRRVFILLGIAGLAFVVFHASRLRTAYSAGKATPTFKEQAILQITPSVQPSQTPIPSATVDYQSTAGIAQQTADEARRVNAVVTSQFEQMVMEQVRITAEHEQRAQQVYAWTHEAAGTSIPLTATQQVIVNTLSARQQQFFYAQQTATEHVPTQMVALARAETSVKFAWWDAMARILFMIFFCALVIGILAVLYRATPDAAEGEREPDTITVTIRRDNGGGYESDRITTIPCTREQLNELAEMAVNGERTFAINRLEKTARTFDRDVLYPFRDWLIVNKFAIVTNQEGDEIALNDDGLQFLDAWFDAHVLPSGYVLDEKEQVVE